MSFNPLDIANGPAVGAVTSTSYAGTRCAR